MWSTEVAAEKIMVAFCSSDIAFCLPLSVRSAKCFCSHDFNRTYALIKLHIMQNAMTLRTANQLCGPQRSSFLIKKGVLRPMRTHQVRIQSQMHKPTLSHQEEILCKWTQLLNPFTRILPYSSNPQISIYPQHEFFHQ